MKKIKNILFPFFEEKYKFLLEKWWFRLLIVVFIILVVVTPFLVFVSYLENNTSPCWKSLNDSIPIASITQFREHSDYCMQVQKITFWESLGIGIITFLITLYGTQLIFFKIIIDFVAMGGKEEFTEKNSK